MQIKKQKKNPKKISREYLHNAGLFYLQRFSASSASFRRVMARKIDRSCRFHQDQDREECLRWLDELVETFTRADLLNDDRYAQSLAENLRRRGASAKAAAMKMAAKGVSANMVDGDLFSLENEQDAALRYAKRRRIGPFASTEEKRDRMKYLAAMARAGFSRTIAESLLKTIS